MPTSDELRLFLQERLRAMDPTLRLDPSSPASVQVIEPTVRRFEPDPLDTDLELFIRTRLYQEYPDLQSGEGSAISDLLVRPLRILLEPFVREIRSIQRNQSLIDPSTLNKDEADALMANIFVTREVGDYAKVVARIYFANPLSVSISNINVVYTASNLRFIPVNTQSITAEGMLFNQEGDLYYFDVSYVAEAPGKAYNIGPGELVGITNLTSAARVTNKRSAEDGVDEETTLQMISRGEQSIGERSLTTVPGVVARLFEQFSGLRILNVIGFNDEAMQRDVISGGNLGDAVIWGEDGDASDDGSGTGYTPYLDSAGSDFTAQFGPVGTDLSGYVLTIWYSGSPHDFDLGAVVGATRVRIDTSYTGTDQIPHASVSGTNTWTIRQRTLTLSGIPGGILFPEVDADTVNVEPDEIHVGGCTDFYVAGDGNSDETQAVQLLGPYTTFEWDESGATVIRRRNATTNGAAVSDKNKITLSDSTQDEYDRITNGTTSIRLLSGSDEGTYRILNSSFATSTITLYVDRDLTASETTVLNSVFDSIDIKLTDVQETIYTGADLRTFAGTQIVDTDSGLTWADYGVVAGQYLEILNGDDTGNYEIQTVAGSQLTLDSAAQNTASPLNYRVYSKQDDELELPLLRVKSVELLSSNMEPTGSFVPYREPIDARSTSFQNPGRGAKAGTSVIITENSYLKSAASGVDTLSAVDSLGSTLTGVDFYSLGVRANDLLNINSSDNQGFYTISEVGGDPTSSLNSYEIKLTETVNWAADDMLYEIGEASHGEFRIYFREPCTFSTTYADTLISVEMSDGTERRFRPDPEIRDEYLPTELTVPVFTMTVAGAVVTMYTPGGASEVGADEYLIQSGDRAEITYAPIVGSADLEAGGLNLDGKNILIDLGSGNERIYFQGTSLDIDEVVDQINTQATRSVATKYVISGTPDEEYLMLRSDSEVTLKYNSDASDCTQTIFGTTRATHMPWLTGNFNDVDTDTTNESHKKGYWYVDAPSDNTVELYEDTALSVAFTGDYLISDTDLAHYVKFTKSGTQRISASDMNENLDAMGLYYFDIECISEGYGDIWNLDPDERGTVTGYTSEGWSISCEDSNLSFSMAEVPWLHINPRVIFVDTEDDPNNYTELTGRNFQITYERSTLVESVHSFVRDTQERVICMNPLARHLLPIYVRTAIYYENGPTTTDARTALVDVIEEVIPESQLEVSDMLAELTNAGATYISLPVEVIGISHQSDRTIITQRSKDIITPGRLSALIPDDDGTTAEGASYLVLERTSV